MDKHSSDAIPSFADSNSLAPEAGLNAKAFVSSPISPNIPKTWTDENPGIQWDKSGRITSADRMNNFSTPFLRKEEVSDVVPKDISQAISNIANDTLRSYFKSQRSLKSLNMGSTLRSVHVSPAQSSFPVSKRVSKGGIYASDLATTYESGDVEEVVRSGGLAPELATNESGIKVIVRPEIELGNLESPTKPDVMLTVDEAEEFEVKIEKKLRHALSNHEFKAPQSHWYWEYWTFVTLLGLGVCYYIYHTTAELHEESRSDVLWYLLVVAKFSAAMMYLTMTSCVLMYLRLVSGAVMSSLYNQYIPTCRDLHKAHRIRGSAFLVFALIHMTAHLIRKYAGDREIGWSIWVSGWSLVGLTIFFCMAMLGRKLPCTSNCFRKKIRWEVLYSVHWLGFCLMMPLALFHKFRFAVVMISLVGLYLLHNVVLWLFNVMKVNIVSHSIRGHATLVIIPKCPPSFSKLVEGKEWFSVDVKVLVPEVSRREFHPFTAIVNATTNVGYILIENYGDWTKKMVSSPKSWLYMQQPPIMLQHALPCDKTKFLIFCTGTFLTTVLGAGPSGCSLLNFDNQQMTVVWVERDPLLVALMITSLLQWVTDRKVIIYITRPSEEKMHQHMVSSQAAAFTRNKKSIMIKAKAPAMNILQMQEEMDRELATQTSESTKDEMEKGTMNFVRSLIPKGSNIEVRKGRPKVSDCFDEVDPDYVFCSCNPVLAKMVMGEAATRNIPGHKYEYL